VTPLAANAKLNRRRRRSAMTSLLFLLFFVTIVLALSNKEKLSFIVYGIAIVACVLWFSHHISDPLAIQL
jgi:hypothetical protein